MKSLLSLLAIVGLISAGSNAYAGNCVADNLSVLTVDKSELKFSPTLTRQTVTVFNSGVDPILVNTAINNTINFVEELGCNGVTLYENESCQVAVNFYAGSGGQSRQYHKKLNVSGSTTTLEVDQTVCLTGIN